MSRNFPTPRKWNPTQPNKYVGDANNIITRSSWETKFMVWADTQPQVLRWNSEQIIVPYFSPVDQRMHNYYVDFAILIQTKTGELKRYLVEIKPSVQCSPPVGSRKTKKLLQESITYAINSAKWQAAEMWAKKKGMEFIIMDEYSLGIKKRPKQ